MCTPLYMAPEIMTQSKYTNKADLWSIGIILYEILFARRPYNANSFYNLIQQVKNNDLTIPEYINISPSCKNLLKSLLVKNPRDRISWDGFFNHPWFTNITHVYKPLKKIHHSDFSFDDAFNSSLDINEDIEFNKKSKNSVESLSSVNSSIRSSVISIN